MAAYTTAMPTLTLVDYDPFAPATAPPSTGPLTAVDYEPFAPQEEA